MRVGRGPPGGGRGPWTTGGRARAAAAPWRAPGRVHLPSPAELAGRLAAWIGEGARRDVANRRLFPWLAVLFGTGILAAFAAEGPLSPWPALGLGLASGIAARASRARFPAFVLLVAVSAWAAGYVATALRFRWVEAPVLDRTVLGRIEGFVLSVEERPGGAGRAVVALRKLDRGTGPGGADPDRVRVTLRDLGGIAPGHYVAGRARLLPPPEAARPGGYDFARDAYFRGIGAVGSAPGRLVRVEPAPVEPDLPLAAAALIDRARNALTSRIAATIGGQPGAVAAALITGKRGLIEERTNDVLRAAGIYHIVSISGLHMVLAAGTLFWLARALLALSPALALGWPIKKLAALVGMAGATAYCVFSGSDVATERSLVMILIMQGAILFDRPALSLRNLALSALVVLAREPESLLGPSFQMSYAAVAGLIALAEWQRERRRGAAEEPEGGWPRRALRWAVAAVAGTVVTTLVATLATGPFSAFHFGNLQPYGIIGNAATLPLVSLAVMPAAVAGVLLYPFGLDRPVWWLMGQAVAAVLALSEWVASFAGSTVLVPASGTGALGAGAAAILCATLLGPGLRRLALAPAGLALLLAASAARPDIYVARDGSGAAVRAPDGRLTLVGRVQAFTAEQWLRADGDGRKAQDRDARRSSRCDALGCVVALGGGRSLSYVADRKGFAEDCRRASIVVSRLRAPADCKPRLALVDRAFLEENGATTLRLTGEGAEIETVRGPGETRPWFARPTPRRPRPMPVTPPRDTSRAEPATPDPDPDLPPIEIPDADEAR